MTTKLTAEQASAVYDAIDAFVEDTDDYMRNFPQEYEAQDRRNWEAKKLVLATVTVWMQKHLGDTGELECTTCAAEQSQPWSAQLHEPAGNCLGCSRPTEHHEPSWA
jgi:hypothetical protein